MVTNFSHQEDLCVCELRKGKKMADIKLGKKWKEASAFQSSRKKFENIRMNGSEKL